MTRTLPVLQSLEYAVLNCFSMNRLAVALLAGLVLSAQIASACGDRLLPIGGGVRMERIAKSAHPGTVLVVSSNPANRAADAQLVAGLVQTGHRAMLVTNTAELQSAVGEQKPDVILVDSGELPAPVLIFGAGVAVVLVLVRPSRQELDAARKTTACIAEVPDWGVSPAVRVVNNIRASQESGMPTKCSERPGSNT